VAHDACFSAGLFAF